jgi:phospholipase A1
MDTIVLIPGIMCSKLKLNGKEIWPLTLSEIIYGYDPQRIAELLDPAAVPDGIIESVACVTVYQPLDDDLEIIANRAGATKVIFAYDWRKDILANTVPLLASTIADLVKSGSKSITLVSHSMGGLIARLLLEGNYQNESWFANIKQLIAICSPHYGAPEALSGALGLTGSNGFAPSDMPRLTSDPRYPAAYQIFPAPHYYRLRQQPGNGRLDVYVNSVAARFDLDTANTAAAKRSFDALDLNERPARVHYSFIAGTHHSTLEQINVTANTFALAYDNVGDGTVPLWSAAPGPIVAFATPGDHTGIFKTYPFRKHLYEILTGSKMTAPHFADSPVLTVSLNKHVYAQNEPMSVLLIPDTPTHEIKGTLQLRRAIDAAGAPVQYGIGQTLQYHGPTTTHLSTSMRAPADVGAYRLTFEGSHTTTSVTAAAFAVSSSGGTRSSRP